MFPSPLNLQRREWKRWCSKCHDARAVWKGPHLYRQLPTKGTIWSCKHSWSSYLHVFPQCFKKTQQVSSPQWYVIKLEAIKVYGLRNRMQRFNMHNKYQQYLYLKFHSLQDLSLVLLTIWGRCSCLITQYSQPRNSWIRIYHSHSKNFLTSAVLW